MTTGRARVSPPGAPPIELAYDLFGAGGWPLVLIMGIGAQRIFWDVQLCEHLAVAGFHVVRFDHRDIGESTRLDLPVPRPGRVTMRRLLLNRTGDVPYTLSDMAGDVAGLVAALGWDSAHVVGASLGGMVGQHLAIEHPTRVRSLTSMISTPGGRRYLPEPRALKALFQPAPRTGEEAGETVARMFTAIGSPLWPVDAERLRAVGRAAHERGPAPRGYLRHYAAVMGTADRRPALRRLHTPTLVIHGTRDPLFPMSAARDMVAMMPDATLLPLAGMGHDLPPGLWPVIVAAIARLARRAEATRGASLRPTAP